MHAYSGSPYNPPAAPVPSSEETSERTREEDEKRAEPSSGAVVPDQDAQVSAIGVADGSPLQSGTQGDGPLGEGEDIPAPTEERSSGSEGQGSALAASTEEVKKTGDEGEAAPSTLPSQSGGGEGEGSGSMVEDPGTGVQPSSGASGGPEQVAGTGADGGPEEPTAAPSADQQPGGESGVEGGGTEVQEIAGEERVQSGGKEGGVGDTPQHRSGDDKKSEPRSGKVGGEEEQMAEGNEVQPSGETDAGADVGESDGLEEVKGAEGRQASPQEGEECGAEGPGEQVESKAAPASGEGGKEETSESVETGAVSGDTVGQEGTGAAGEEGKEGGQKSKVEEEEKAALPDDFFYDYDSLVSKPEVVDLLPGVLSLQYPPCETCVCVLFVKCVCMCAWCTRLAP